MKGKNLLILVVAALVLIGLAMLSSRDSSKSSPSAIGKLVLPNLPLNEVERVVVSTPTEAITLAKVDDTWVTPSRFGYPADFQKIKDAVLKLSELKIGQVMRLTDSQKAAMKIAAPASGSTNSGTLVEMFDAKGKKLASLLLGGSHQSKPRGGPEFGGYGGYPDGQYLSPDGGKSVYLVAGALDSFSPKTRDWLDTEVLNVNSSDIGDITITGPDGKGLRLARKDGAKLEAEGLAPDEETDASKLYSVESALSYLRFSDVADPALTDAETGLDKPAVFQASTSKGQVYTVKVGSSPTNSADRYVRFEVALKPAATNQPAADAGGTNAAAARKQLEEETQALGAKIGKWTYLVESYKADAMLTKRDSVVKKKEPPKVEETPAAAVTTDPAPAAPKVETPPAAAEKPATPPAPPAPPATAPAEQPAAAPAAQPGAAQVEQKAPQPDAAGK